MVPRSLDRVEDVVGLEEAVVRVDRLVTVGVGEEELQAGIKEAVCWVIDE